MPRAETNRSTKHFATADGASLIYTAPSAPSQLPTLLHSSLGIHSLLKKQPLKPNVIDRDKIVVPPNWDSWGKIRVLREGFDVEKVSEGWSIDLEQPFPAEPVHTNGTTTKTDDTPGHDGATISNGHAGEPESPPDPEGSTVVLYEQAVHDPSTDALQQAGRSNHSTRLEMDTQDPQAFLAQQQKLLETYRQQNELEARENPDARARAYDARAGGGLGGAPEANKVQDHIGPVQFNVGGIQVDADDMVQRLRVSLDAYTYGDIVMVMGGRLLTRCVSCRTDNSTHPTRKRRGPTGRPRTRR